MIKEAQIEQTLVSEIKRRGGLCFKMTGYRGIPDRLVLLPNGRAIFIELKRPGGKVRSTQEKAHKVLRQLGFDSWVLDDIDLIDFVLGVRYE